MSSDRARLLPRASLVREAKRLFESGSIDKGRCPLCGQKVDGERLAQRIESALVEVMEASRDLERVRDPIAQQADDLEARTPEAALDSRPRARHGARRCRPCPTSRTPASDTASTRWRRSKIDAITSAVSELRKWDRSAGALARKASPAEPSTRDTQLVMLAALCQQVNAWRLAEKKATRARRALELAERVFDAYQNKQKEDLTELLKRISHRVAQIYSRSTPERTSMR